MEKISLVIVEDHPVMLAGIQQLFKKQADFEVVGVAEDMGQLENLLLEADPTVVLMDVELPQGDGIAATVLVRKHRPNAKVVIFTGYDNPDIARVTHQSEYGHWGVKKKARSLSQVNTTVVAGCCPDAITVEIRRVEAAEVDEMWSFVQSKAHQRWLWHAIDHLTGVVLAYVFGSRADAVFVELQKLLKPFGLVHFYTDAAGVYERHLPAGAHTVGKVHTQQIERKHLTLRTRINRLAQKTICFSKSVFMHDTVIGLFVNRYEFGLPV